MGLRQLLDHEHDQISAMLIVLDATVSRLGQRLYVAPDMIVGILRFFERYVRDCHEKKEDSILFPYIEAGLPRRHAALETFGVLKEHHTRAPRLLDELVYRSTVIHTTNIQALHTATTDYVQLLTDHLGLEKSILDTITAEQLPAENEGGLWAECVQFDRQILGPTGPEWYAQLVRDYTDIVSSWSRSPVVQSVRAGCPVCRGAVLQDLGIRTQPDNALQWRSVRMWWCSRCGYTDYERLPSPPL